MLQKLNSLEKFDLQWLLILILGAIYFSFTRNEYVPELLWLLPVLALLILVKTPLMQIDIAKRIKFSAKGMSVFFYISLLVSLAGYLLIPSYVSIGKGLDQNSDLYQWYLTVWGQDWRYLLVVVHGMSGFLLYRMRDKENPLSVLPSIAFLFVPAAIFISSQNWNDSINLFWILLAVWGLEKSRMGVFYLALNLLLLASPYHWLFLPVFYALLGKRESLISFLAKSVVVPLISYLLVLRFSSDVLSGFVRSVAAYPGMIQQGIVLQFIRSYFFGSWFLSLTAFKSLAVGLLLVLGFNWSRRSLWICVATLFWGLPFFNHIWLLFGSFLIFYHRGLNQSKQVREVSYEMIAFWSTRLFLVISLPLRYSDLIYYKKIGEYIWSGRVPFVDFSFEYPPLALIPMWIGKVFSAIFDSYDLGVYRLGYMTMLLILDLFFFGFLQRQNWNGLVTKSALWIYILGGLVMGELIYDRLDLLLGMSFVLMMFWSWERKYAQALAMAVVGAYFKLLTLITLPLTVIDLWKSEKPRREKLELLIGAGCGFLICLGLCLIFFEDKFVNFLIYHRNRGLQVESLWSSLLYFVTFAKLDFMPYFATISNYGALHVRNAPDFMVTVATLVPVILLFLVYWIHAISSKVRNDEWREKRLFFLAVLVFTTFGKVLSPQYLIWTLCLYPFCHFDLSKKSDRWITGMFALALVLTGAIFHFYFFVMILRPWMWGLILLRNLLLVGMAVIEFWQLWPSRDHRSEHKHPPTIPES